jgi:hypothetical protein
VTINPLGCPPWSAEHESSQTRTHDSYTTPRDATRVRDVAGAMGTRTEVDKRTREKLLSKISSRIWRLHCSHFLSVHSL